MLEIMKIQQKAKTSTNKCSRCQDPAVSHCASCEKFMCKTCTDSHDSWFNHDVVSVDELSNPASQVKMRSKLYCVKHKGEVLKYYCETCKELCCIDCVVLNHQKPNHSCLAVSEIAEKQRETLGVTCTTLDEKLSERKEALDNIRDKMESLEKNAKTAKGQIKKQKENILKRVVEQLDEKEKKMNEKVDEVYGELHKELTEQHDKIKEHVEKVQASVSLSKNLLKSGSIEEILSSQKLIDENMEKFRNENEEEDYLGEVNDGGIQYLPGDIGNVNVDDIVSKLGCVEGTFKCPHTRYELNAVILAFKNDSLRHYSCF